MFTIIKINLTNNTSKIHYYTNNKELRQVVSQYTQQLDSMDILVENVLEQDLQYNLTRMTVKYQEDTSLTNKDIYKEYQANYYEKNKTKLLLSKKINNNKFWKCEKCNKIIKLSSKYYHLQSKKHQ